MIVQKILLYDPVQCMQFSEHMLNILQNEQWSSPQIKRTSIWTIMLISKTVDIE